MNSNLPQCKTEQELLQRYAAIAYDKQTDFSEVIGTNDWNIDMKSGVIRFGEGLEFPIQVLGTVSHSSQTWLWAWANTQSGLSEQIIQQSLVLKKYGEENEIDLLKNASFNFSKEDLHVIGMIASGMFESSGYYIADYGQGAMVVTIKSDLIDAAQTQNHLRVLTVFPQIISMFEMNHKQALISYLTAKEFVISTEGNSLTATKEGQTIQASFNESSNLISLNGDAHGCSSAVSL